MSISATYFVDRTIARAAKELDLILALAENKVPRESAKLRALKGALEAAQDRYRSFIAKTGLPAGQAGSLAHDLVRAMRADQFAEVKRKRDLRAAYEAERQEMLASGILTA